MAVFERESMYQMLANRDWEGLSNTLVVHAKELTNDPITQQAVGFFETEFFADCADYPSKARYQKFEHIALMIELGKHGFSKAFQDRFVDEKLKVMQELSLPSLLSFALSNQHRPLAKQIIQERRSVQPEQIAQARRGDISIKANQIHDAAPKTVKLFKSQQEENFFEAVRRVFPTYNPYPNVALSSVLDINAFKDDLTSKEHSYFFRAVVDSVVFDARDSYTPKFFFELDSVHHDSAQARENDSMKDAIFRAANVKLTRIRGYGSKALTVQEFERLVVDVMQAGVLR
ncbi:DUF2726 domain-containing protein [Pseudomonas baetica]|uniref:DUF2726 domain-containing protein n=1 Tax=Pseudomonas baetica TaxID=674054 RepID=UPI003EEC9489